MSTDEAQRPVASITRGCVRVVVSRELGERALQITSIPEQHMIEKFSQHRPDQALDEGCDSSTCGGVLRRAPHNLDAIRPKFSETRFPFACTAKADVSSGSSRLPRESSVSKSQESIEIRPKETLSDLLVVHGGKLARARPRGCPSDVSVDVTARSHRSPITSDGSMSGIQHGAIEARPSATGAEPMPTSTVPSNHGPTRRAFLR